MKLKKVIAIIVAVCVVCGGTAGGIQYYKSYQQKNQTVEVQSVASLNWGYWGDSMTSYGMVTNDSAQEIYLEDAKTVEQVYVQEGDTVKKGDPLLKYNSEELDTEIKRKELEHSNLLNTISVTNHELEELRQTIPVDKTPPEIYSSLLEDDEAEDIEEEEEEEVLPERDEKDSRIFNYVTEDSVPYNVKTADGSEENPYIYYCNADAYAYGSFFNSIRPDGDEPGKYVKFIICKKDENGKMVFESEDVMESDKEDSETEQSEEEDTFKEEVQREDGEREKIELEDLKDKISEKEESKQQTKAAQILESDGMTVKIVAVQNEIYMSESDKESKKNLVPAVDKSKSPNTIVYNGNNFPTEYDDDRMWYIFSGEEVDDALEDLLEQLEEEQEWEEPEGYSEEELAAAIKEKEQLLKTMDLERRRSELELQSLRSTEEDGTVYAKIDGIVKSVGDPESSDTGDAFLVLAGEGGLYVKGTVSELLLDQVTPGTVITANSWETGNTFEATVTEISDYPVEGNSWGEGNPNVSYYEYTAYIEDSSALKNGEYVDLSIEQEQTEETDGGIYLEKAYVREENGKPYCMIADENGRLKKQYVQTGKTVYGSAIEIKAGLSESDLIAFPYGKNAVEGAMVTEESDMYY